MDKAAIKTFAINSRTRLMQDVRDEMYNLGITENNIADSISNTKGIQTFQISSSETYSIYDEDIKKRDSLVREVKAKGFENVVEEVSYTWFNRIIAIRFMEINNYLPTKTRVLSSETPNKIEPDIVTEVFDLDLDFTDEDRELIFKLKDENKSDDLFQFLFIKQCNKLNDILPGLFEKTEDYMELLLNISYTGEGVIPNLIKDISEEDFGEQVEIIGWLYQFYNTERKNKAIDTIKTKPIKKEDIPAATQLFTPDWIVKYMVDNSLGRYWIERNPNSNLINSLEYYFEEPKQLDEINLKLQKIRSKNISIENIKFFDPCMGSGHILIYAFDVLMEIYNELGYSQREIPELILTNNLYGLDIDKRAYQLAYFALMMKGRKNDRTFLNKNILPNISFMIDSKISEKTLNYINNFDFDLASNIVYLNNIFSNGGEFGSLIQVKKLDFEFIESKLNELLNKINSTIFDLSISNEIKTNIFHLLNQAKILSLKYEVVVTNPPYMNKFDKSFKKFANENYKDYSKDLFSMFIYRNFGFCTYDGYVAFMTPMVWMFIKTYEQLRDYLINQKSIISFIELEYGAIWDIAHVPICTFILSNLNNDSKYYGTFTKLSKFVGGIEVQDQKTLNAVNNDVDYKYFVNGDKFNKIPGKPLAYWVDKDIINSFENGIELQEIGDAKAGLATGNNDEFLRLWYEVDFNKLYLTCESRESSKNSGLKWFPYNKGGKYRKWYGNHDFVVNWENDGYDLSNYPKSVLRNPSFYFKKSISWSLLSSAYFGVRFYPEGFLFDVNGSSLFMPEKYHYYVGGFLGSKISTILLSVLNSTLSFQVGNIQTLPLIINENKLDEINSIVKDNIRIAKLDWDDYETSWNFLSNPLLKFKQRNMECSFLEWKNYKDSQFNKLKNNEVMLNTIFSDIYSIDINYDIESNEISLSKADYESDVKSFISYAVGCMFGRYSLDEEGLQFAGGEFDLSKYHKFVPDEDNIIPVLDTPYFEDDIVGRFIEFVKTCFGEETLEENLDFIAKALSNKNKTSREIIRDYFLNDFFNNHLKKYSQPRIKSPIYWMFSSGKENGFKCLVYMHRYTPDLVARIRTEYLHKTQKAIEQNIVRCENIINVNSSNTEKKRAISEKNKLEKQLQETREYDEALAHIANQKIEIDLDDGVKVNYAKFQKIEVSKEGQKTKTLNLLKNI